MELALSLGDASKSFTAAPKPKDFAFRMALGLNAAAGAGDVRGKDAGHGLGHADSNSDGGGGLPLQLDLLPFSPVPRAKPFVIPWLAERAFSHAEPDSSSAGDRGGQDEGGAHSSPNSAASSFHMEFGFGNGGSGGRSGKRDVDAEGERGSDDDENGLARKKLRLSKEQSAFLEESFKEHSTLNPKQKLALAKQLNLRPRQVEVWFQNRRARTKLKQTEIDCEYLKRCCETLTEENRRLQKELQELRALKTSQPFYMQLPATTLTMCPSCERVATAGAPSQPRPAKPKSAFPPVAHSQVHKAAS